jgi:hypothetical protein
VSRTTLQNTLTEMYGLLASDANGTPVTALANAGATKVYPHEPGAAGVVKPCGVTISPSAIEPLEWGVALRVYVADLTPDKAQDLLIDVPVAIDALLAAGQGYGPSNWEMGWEQDIGCWAAVSTLRVGREDGF